MDCKTFEKELPDLVLTAGAKPSLAAVAHMKTCPPCAEEYLSFQQTFGLLDSWKVPEPTPYFDQKLAVMIREEQAKPKMGWFERLETRLKLNTGRNFRPAMVGALALALMVSGGSVVGNNLSRPEVQPAPSATIRDLQILDRNEQAFQQLDSLQQDENDNAQPNAAPNQVSPPVS
jgi:hypothetical protein